MPIPADLRQHAWLSGLLHRVESECLTAEPQAMKATAKGSLLGWLHGRLIGVVGGTVIAALGCACLVLGVLVPILHRMTLCGLAMMVLGALAVAQTVRRP